MSNYRFKLGKKIAINAPSKTLHITNLVKQVCKDDYELRQLFEPYGAINKMM